MIIYNTYPPQPYGNLKTLCDDLRVSYHTYKVKKYPFKINGIEVFKTEIKREGGEKRKTKNLQQLIRAQMFDALVYNEKVYDFEPINGTKLR